MLETGRGIQLMKSVVLHDQACSFHFWSLERASLSRTEVAGRILRTVGLPCRSPRNAISTQREKDGERGKCFPLVSNSF